MVSMAPMLLLWYVPWTSIIANCDGLCRFYIGCGDRGWIKRLTNPQQYTAAAKSSTLDSTARAMEALNQVYHKDAKLAKIMEAPTLSAADKSAIISELQKHTGGADKGDTVKNFLDTLAAYNRLSLLKGVCEKFGELMSAAKGEVELTVTSASVG
jgi:ATP synthase delta (OSCP) subunit